MTQFPQTSRISETVKHSSSTLCYECYLPRERCVSYEIFEKRLLFQGLWEPRGDRFDSLPQH
uniref:Uncharacterized protein n=1 Tax=Anguilla anguilla TaxID=7936 RepID=A0A0E9Q836_ANGAN